MIKEKTRGLLIYTAATAKFEEFLSKLAKIGTPRQVNTHWLKTLGYSTNNDFTFIRVLSAIGLIDSNNQPTHLWNALRLQDQQSKINIATALKKSYASLFDVYPDAHQRSESELLSFFVSFSGLSKRTAQLATATFKSLILFAHFQSLPQTKNVNQDITAHRQSKSNAPGEIEIMLESNIRVVVPNKYALALALGEYSEAFKILNNAK